MRKYHVRYELSNCCVARGHRSFRAALQDLRSCRAAAAKGGDSQGIHLEAWDGNARMQLTDAEWAATEGQ